eukprot:scaffold2094_cov239-Pinguiococcus_pyrenoidosus.AAC.17
MLRPRNRFEVWVWQICFTSPQAAGATQPPAPLPLHPLSLFGPQEPRGAREDAERALLPPEI